MSNAIEKMLWKFPIEARIYTRKVAALGMTISLEEIEGTAHLCWQGSNDLFTKSAVFNAGFDFASVKRKKYVAPHGLRGDLLRQPNGELKFAISWCHFSSRPLKCMRNARADNAFSRFKEMCFVPIENLKVETDSD